MRINHALTPRLGKLLLVLAPVVALLAAWPAYLARQAYRAERAGFLPQPHAPRKSLADFAIPGLRAVTFTSRTGTLLAGYYAPSKNGAAVALCHGFQGDRSDTVDEARILASAGFGVLAFDWPGHGESAGEIRWGEPERLALQGALDFLSQEPGASARLGAYGFSMGGYIVTQVAAVDVRLRAVALAGSPHDPVEHTRWEYRRFGWLQQAPALWALERSGMSLTERLPKDEIGKIAPRSVLLIRGAEDHVVPDWITERLLLAAGNPKQLYVVAGAGHGGYAAAQPQAYAAALVGFFGLLNAPKAP